MKLALWVGMACVMAMTGCITTALPNIPHHHWKRAPFGASLYADDGHESASFIGNIGGDPAQVCDFDSSTSCHYFESNEQALNWLRLQYY